MSTVEIIERQGRVIYKMLTPYRVTVPVGKRGDWTIARRVIEMDIAYLRHVRDGRHPGIGEVSWLSHKHRGCVMSDTAAEICDLRPHLNRLARRAGDGSWAGNGATCPDAITGA